MCHGHQGRATATTNGFQSRDESGAAGDLTHSCHVPKESSGLVCFQGDGEDGSHSDAESQDSVTEYELSAPADAPDTAEATEEAPAKEAAEKQGLEKKTGEEGVGVESRRDDSDNSEHTEEVKRIGSLPREPASDSETGSERTGSKEARRSPDRKLGTEAAVKQGDINANETLSDDPGIGGPAECDSIDSADSGPADPGRLTSVQTDDNETVHCAPDASELKAMPTATGTSPAGDSDADVAMDTSEPVQSPGADANGQVGPEPEASDLDHVDENRNRGGTAATNNNAPRKSGDFQEVALASESDAPAETETLRVRGAKSGEERGETDSEIKPLALSVFCTDHVTGASCQLVIVGVAVVTCSRVRDRDDEACNVCRLSHLLRH